MKSFARYENSEIYVHHLYHKNFQNNQTLIFAQFQSNNGRDRNQQ